MSVNLSFVLDLLVQFLKIPVLVLSAVLLYRLDRVIASGMRSAEVIEDTAENLEKSSDAFRSLTGFVDRIPGVNTDRRSDNRE